VTSYILWFKKKDETEISLKTYFYRNYQKRREGSILHHQTHPLHPDFPWAIAYYIFFANKRGGDDISLKKTKFYKHYQKGWRSSPTPQHPLDWAICLA
jgi:hypothetical protein